MKRLFHWRQTLSLARLDVRSRYSGTSLGAAWAFVQPVISIAAYYAVFGMGLGFQGSNQGFFQFLVLGFLPWMFFAEGVSASSDVLVSKSFLIKKSIFPIYSIPVAACLSLFVVHFIIFFLFLMALAAVGRISLSLNWPLWLFFEMQLALLVFGLVLFQAAVAPIVKDSRHVVTALLGLFFWACPIVWSPHQISPRAIRVLELNPLFGILTGIRWAVTGSQEYELPLESLVKSGVGTLVVLAVGFFLFSRLRTLVVEEL